MASALRINIGSINVGHVGQAQPEGRSRAGPGEDAHTGGGLSPTKSHEEEEEEEEEEKEEEGGRGRKDSSKGIESSADAVRYDSKEGLEE